MTAPVQIRKPEVVRDIRELAALTGLPITDAVADAVRAELKRARASRSIEQRRDAVDRIVRDLHRHPQVGEPLTDDDLYDEDGLPR